MKFKRKFKYLVLTLVMSMLFSLPVFASSTDHDASSAYDTLVGALATGKYANKNIDYSTGSSAKKYKLDGGGYALWGEITTPTSPKDLINEDAFGSLTPSAKQDFLEDYLTLAQAMADDKNCIVTDDTVTDMSVQLQQKSGMGSQLMATLMANTKPDFITANRIYEPFSGPIGTALGLISILIMALLGLTMALDIAYIVIPAFQLVLDGGGNGEGKKGGISGIISQAAKNAVNSRDGGNGGQGGSGNKIALATYFKYRWIELVVLGICLLYLVQGQIYSFVAWILDLVSGFLGF